MAAQDNLSKHQFDGAKRSLEYHPEGNRSMSDDEMKQIAHPEGTLCPHCGVTHNFHP